MNKVINNILKVSLSLSLIFIAFYFLYPEVSSHISRHLEIQSSFSVKGYYYSLNMDQLTKMSVDSNKIVLTGYNVFFYQKSDEYQIERKYPEKYSKLDTSWILLDSSTSSIGNTIRTFKHKISGKELSVTLPFWNSNPEWVALRNDYNETLLILSSGDWKRSENVYLGFIEVKI